VGKFSKWFPAVVVAGVAFPVDKEFGAEGGGSMGRECVPERRLPVLQIQHRGLDLGIGMGEEGNRGGERKRGRLCGRQG
jgi:hypothetical protein